jgi:carbonic anhydrase
LHTPLIVVVGHEKCGAVSAALGGGHAPGHISSIVETILPSVEKVKGDAGDPLENAVRANSQRMATTLAQTGPIISEAVKAGQTKVVSAVYSLGSGKVEVLK